MEIKRRLGKIVKTLNPEVEAMNVAAEMLQLCTRLEELIKYAQTKIDRSKERKESAGVKAAAAKEAADKKVRDAQAAEAEENLKDQQEASDERNKKPDIVVEGDGDGTVSDDVDPGAGND
jgi:NAD kinase